MAMPIDLVLIRHGQSESNVIQHSLNTDENAVVPPEFLERHDTRMRLSSEGREQARKTGVFLQSEFPDGFDKYYVSPLARTLETAGYLAINGDWSIDDRWRERDWGEFMLLNTAERLKQYPNSERLFRQAKWYWGPPGGESLSTNVRLRFEDILDTLHREQSDNKVIAVTHGETIWVARFVLERLTPEEWMLQEKDPAYKVLNTVVIHYSRRNPETGEIDSRLRWRRVICPWDESLSWNKGKWTEITHKNYTDSEIIALAEQHETLLSD
jgi:broad specificity phosphatase PhoE